MKYPFVRQHDEKDCGAACLSMICAYYGKKLRLATVRDAIQVDQCGANIYGVVTGAESLGLYADPLEGSLQELLEGLQMKEFRLPIIARILNEFGFEHYIVIYQIHGNRITIGDPCKAKVTSMSIETFSRQWLGQIIAFAPSEAWQPCNERKGCYAHYFKLLFAQKKLLLFLFILSILICSINVASSVVFEYVLSSTELSVENDDSHVTEEQNEHQDETGLTLDSSDIKYGRVVSILDRTTSKLDIIFRNINTVCISIIVLYLFNCAMQILRSVLLAQSAKKVNVPLAEEYYQHLIKLPHSFFESRKTGELMSRFYDISSIRNAISSMALCVIYDCLMAIGCGLVLLYISKELFFITLVELLVLLIVVVLFKNPLSQVNYDYMDKDAEFTSFLKESIDGISTIKLYPSHNRMIPRMKHLFDSYINQFVKGSILGNVQDILIRSVTAISTIVLLWQGARLCIAGSISLADLFIFYYLMSFYIEPLKNLTYLQPAFQAALVAIDRLNDVFDTQPEKLGETMQTLEKIETIQVNDISFRYGNRDLVLNKISLEFHKGEKIALLGESGCGKTTLAKLLVHLYQPEKGEILVNGNSIDAYTLTSLRDKIALVSQENTLFSASIFENLVMGDTSISKEAVENVCKLCRIHDFITSQPLGYETILGENGTSISNGQKQRLFIARALLHKPDVLIFDEASCHLDPITEHEILQAILTDCKEQICIFITHSPQRIVDYDHIYVMEHGRLLEDGSHDALMQKKRGL